jgi:hypothetical protein
LRRCFRLLATVALVILAGCGPRPHALTPDDVQKDLARVASGYDSPDYPGQGRLPGNRDAPCIVRHARSVDFAGKSLTMTAVFVSASKTCDGADSVLLTLWAPSGSSSPGEIVQIGGRATDFGYHAGTKCLSDCGLGFLLRGESTSKADDFLRRLLDNEPLSAAALPPWPADALQPSLPAELTFQPSTDRATYEAVRKLGATTLCWKPEDIQLRCIAAAPRRHPAQIDLFVVHGFDGFRSLDARQSVARLSR